MSIVLPSGTELTNISEPFVANDGGRWFVMQNVDYQDREGYPGMSTETLASPHGYDTQAEAEAAMADLESGDDARPAERAAYGLPENA